MPVVARGLGGKKIKDATALSDDVRKGKVFYNNKGRQVGTGDFPEVKTVSVEIGKRSGGSLTYPAVSLYLLGEETRIFKYSSEDTAWHSDKALFFNKAKIDPTVIIGFEVDGTYYDFFVGIENTPYYGSLHEFYASEEEGDYVDGYLFAFNIDTDRISVRAPDEEAEYYGKRVTFYYV